MKGNLRQLSVTLTIIHGLSATVGFGILFFYGYSSATALAFLTLLNVPYILRLVATKGSKAESAKVERPKMSISSFLTFLSILFGFVAFTLAITKIDKKSFQIIIENKTFLIAFYFCFMSALIADGMRKPR